MRDRSNSADGNPDRDLSAEHPPSPLEVEGEERDDQPREASIDQSGRVTTGFGRYLFKHVSGAIVSLLLVLFSSFFIFRLIAGDPIDQLTRERPVTPEQRETMREEMGLNDPLFTQFIDYITGMLTGDFGISLQFRRPILELILERLPATLLLSGTGLVLAVALGFLVGTKAGWRQGSRFDRTQVTTGLLLYSAPTFWLGMLAILVFARYLGWFPVNGMRSPNTPDDFFSQALDIGHHLVLPVLTYTAVVYAGYLMVMRSSILDEVGSDYLTTARAKGLRDDKVRRKHAIPNALLPTITLVFLAIGNIVNGAIVTETVFSWPGLGRLFVQSIFYPDRPMLQALFVLFSSATIIAVLFAEILYWFIDPRVRKS
ncbi:ABC transporter permease [Natronoglycomyces albus]|uniref:ABC transporter permease n=1 Tax=Natronoglycomyces albus TaxID=2811108 RepID=A0A895XHV5_9ACTN|nr:ABC transporter permease [Natronoglycomyces albus]QSB04914.1 ABC transporter permease [Natronoglycomyces albus]